MNQLPKFFPQPGSIVWPQPTLMQNTMVYSFLVECKYDALLKLCNQHFSDVSQGAVNYIPVCSTVLLTFSQTERLKSLNPKASDLGGFPGTDVTWWIPVIAVEKKGDGWKALRLGLFVPFIFVDTALSMAPGREIFGYPKTVADIQIPQDVPGSAGMFQVNTWGIRKFSPDALAEPMDIIQIRRDPETSALPVEAKDFFALILELFHKAKTTVNILNPEFLLSLVKDALSLSIPLVFLRQYRDIQEANNCCYQAICEAPIEFGAPSGAGLLKGVSLLTLHACDSFPLGNALGLPLDTEIPMPGLWSKADLTLQTGKVIWSPDLT